MVIDNVHDEAEICLMVGINHLLQLQDPLVRIICLGTKTSFRNIVLHRIIAPIVARSRVGFIHASEIIEGQELNMSNAQGFQIVKAKGLFSMFRRF